MHVLFIVEKIISRFMLRKLHIERPVSCHHLLIRSVLQVVRNTVWTPDIVMSLPHPFKSLDIKRPS